MQHEECRGQDASEEDNKEKEAKIYQKDIKGSRFTQTSSVLFRQKSSAINMMESVGRKKRISS